MKAVLLVGGEGLRMRPFTEFLPKCMAFVAGRTVIEWQIDWLRSHGIRRVVVCCSSANRDKIEWLLGDGSRFGVRVEYSAEPVPVGTARALWVAYPLLKREDRFLVVNGDVITDLDPWRLVDGVGEEYAASVALVRARCPYGVAKLEGERVVAFEEKTTMPFWINAGVYCFSPQAWPYFAAVRVAPSYIAKHVLPALARDGLLRGVTYEAVYWRSIETLKDAVEASMELAERL